LNQFPSQLPPNLVCILMEIRYHRFFPQHSLH
jgi:hypothetical protein